MRYDNDSRGVYPDLDEAGIDSRYAEDDRYDDYEPDYERPVFNSSGFNAKGVHRNGTPYDDRGFDAKGVHRETGTRYDPEGFDALELDADNFTRDGFNIITMETRPKSAPVTRSAPVVALSDGRVVKFGFKDGAPHTVQELDTSTYAWGRTMVVVSPAGKALVEAAKLSSAEERKVPAETARAYAEASGGSCLLCGRALSDPTSQTRGYGPECASKVRSG